MNSFKLIYGILFLALGIIALLAAINAISLSWDYFWPLFILIPGISFEYTFFNQRSKGIKNPGILVPGGILITIGILFYINVFFGWHLMEYLWPVFILAPAAGLFQLYLFGPRVKALLIPVGILTGIGCFSLIVEMFKIDFFVYIFSIVLIALGVYLIFRSVKKPDDYQ
jgi:hypothetical protein